MIVYDVEIERCIPDQQPNDPRYQYCEGWDDYAGMGIACICTFDLVARQPRIFLKDNFGAFRHYTLSGALVGFNNHSFDDRVIAAAGAAPPVSHDLLGSIRAAAGEPSIYTYGQTKGSRRLGGLAGLNGVPYRGPGAIVDAPQEWQRGNHGIVIDYCMRDVMMLVALVDLARAQGFLLDSATGEIVTLPPPFAPLQTTAV